MKRAIRTLLRLVAAGFIVFGGMTIGLALMRRRTPKAEASSWPFVLGAVLTALGMVLFWASGRLAERLADDFEE